MNQNESSENRDAGISTAVNHADAVIPNWSVSALGFVRLYPEEEFMAEELRKWAHENGLPKPPHLRAWGGVMVQAKRIGLIEHIGYKRVKNPKAHRTPAGLWKKLI